MKYRILLFFLTTGISFQLVAQSLYEVSLNEKTTRSSLIIEGKVIRQTGFWNANHTMIYTASTVEVYKIFKGSYNKDSIDIITEGGSVGYEIIESSETLKLSVNQIGVFFLYPNVLGIKSPGSLQTLWDVYSSSQGFLNYDLIHGAASAPFARYKDITNDLYNELRNKTRREFENRKPAFSIYAITNKSNAKQLSTLAPTISSFSPAIVNAGSLLDPANNVLTINGSGFGNSPSGSAGVFFDDADNGPGGTPYGIAYNDPLIISWTDTQIQLRVPTKAGTGALIVQDAVGNNTTAPTNLEVLYSVQTASFSFSGSTYTKEVNLINANGTGGYTIFYSTNTAGSGVNFDTDPAKQTFQRALTTWKEIAGFNVTEGGTTSSQTSSAADGVCTIMFDNLNTGRAPLAAGVLATCYSFMSTCPTSFTVNQIEKTEFDVVIRSAVSSGSATFTIGPCPPNASNFTETDLETVILHELGHAINLGHINDSYQGSSVGQINPNKLMNYAIVNSARRNTPDYSAKAGALYAITPQGAITGSCLSWGEMTPLSTITEPNDNCPASFPVTPTPAGTSVAFDLVHAGSNRYVDPAYTQIRCDGIGASITNNAYYAFRTSPAGGILSLIVSGYSTTPAALASCTQVYAGVPVTGIRLSLYQASSCPAAGAFPTPVNCQTFSSNGALSNISGLTGSTNYLLYLEGIEDTKASFSITFGGSVLPIKFESFTGKVLSNSNQLNWTIGYYTDIKRLILEKSSDGFDYYSIDSIPDYAVSETGSYIDSKPVAGNNYYRLAAVNPDGSKQYSSVVILERNDKFLAALYPNPASHSIHLEVSSEKSGRYTFDIYNAAGQLIQKQTSTILHSRQIINMPADNLANGVYFLKISDEKNEPIRNIQFTIRH
jgi:hypothetical protein